MHQNFDLKVIVQVLTSLSVQKLGLYNSQSIIILPIRDYSVHSLIQAAAKRSNTCILVKNLPASTTPDQLEELFSKYGEVFRIVLPPSGITAIVQMPVPVEAQAAFKRLAYKRFGDTPLYLEWAPTGTLLNEQEVQETAKSRKEQEGEEVKSEIEAEVKVEPSTSDATMDDMVRLYLN